jgi:signal transduction histidine kinase
LAEVESGKMIKREPVSLKELVLEEKSRAQTLAGNRKIVLGNQEDLLVRADAYQLKQLLSNLVDNAVKYTPDGGTITLSLYKEDQWARLDVSDTGIGIASEHLPFLFNRFYRVDKVRSRAREGTGLGLAIVKGIAEQHDGTVTVSSEPGKGSTFTLRLKL